MTRIVFLDRGSIGPNVDLCRPRFDHEWVAHERTSPGDVLERLDGAEIAITNKVPLTSDALLRLRHLKMVAVAATGYDIVDIEACNRSGIVVSNVRGYAIDTVPEHTFALILALRRNIVGFRSDVIDGEWQRAGQFCFFNHPISDLSGSTLGIVGEGVIGQAVARLGQAFGMRCLFAAHKGVDGMGPLYTPFQEVLESSDVITLHCPLTPGTKNVLGRAEFEQMRRRPILINAARGGLVDETAVVAALDAGLIAGIGFDCLSSEPPPSDHPFAALLQRPNVIVTPHVAWASDQAMQTLWNQVIEHVENFHAGIPSNVVN